MGVSERMELLLGALSSVFPCSTDRGPPVVDLENAPHFPCAGEQGALRACVPCQAEKWGVRMLCLFPNKLGHYRNP